MRANILLIEEDGIQTFTAGRDRLISWDENDEYVYFVQEYNEKNGEWEQREQCDSLGEGISALLETIDFRQQTTKE